MQHSPQDLALISAKADVLKKLMRYEEANAEYDRIERIDPRSFYVLSSIMGQVDLGKVAAAKTRLEAGGKVISDETIEAEIRLMHQEKRAAELKAALRASPLFGPLCLLMQERQEWSGTQNRTPCRVLILLANPFVTLGLSVNSYAICAHERGSPAVSELRKNLFIRQTT